jgi:hypothetical protein
MPTIFNTNNSTNNTTALALLGLGASVAAEVLIERARRRAITRAGYCPAADLKVVEGEVAALHDRMDRDRAERAVKRATARWMGGTVLSLPGGDLGAAASRVIEGARELAWTPRWEEEDRLRAFEALFLLREASSHLPREVEDELNRVLDLIMRLPAHREEAKEWLAEIKRRKCR